MTFEYCQRLCKSVILQRKSQLKANIKTKRKMKKTAIASIALAIIAAQAATESQAQVAAFDSVSTHQRGNRLSIGGYGEVALTRNFYSDNVYRYSQASKYKDAPGHGRFDIPHAVVYISYDFGKGWTMSSEIEFEHGGAGGAVEKEFEEAGEWEQETEKGGEVELEQFWIQKSFARWANIRVGHFVVPVGFTNAYHEPLNFFTVYRPEGEATILPCTWHDTGISFWGRSGDFRYEVQLIAGLDGFLFDRDNWIQNGAGSPFEFKVANKYGFAARIDNYTIPGLRIGLSGYYGRSMHNTFPHDLESNGNKYKEVKGTVAIGAIDFAYNAHNWIVSEGNRGHRSHRLRLQRPQLDCPRQCRLWLCGRRSRHQRGKAQHQRNERALQEVARGQKRLRNRR